MGTAAGGVVLSARHAPALQSGYVQTEAVEPQQLGLLAYHRRANIGFLGTSSNQSCVPPEVPAVCCPGTQKSHAGASRVTLYPGQHRRGLPGIYWCINGCLALHSLAVSLACLSGLSCIAVVVCRKVAAPLGLSRRARRLDAACQAGHLSYRFENVGVPLPYVSAANMRVPLAFLSSSTSLFCLLAFQPGYDGHKVVFSDYCNNCNSCYASDAARL